MEPLSPKLSWLPLVQRTKKMFSSIKSLLSNRRTGYLLTGILLIIFLFFFVLAPILSVFSQSFLSSTSDFTFLNYQNMFHEKETLEAIGNSLLLGLAVTGISVLIAIPEAYILAKTRLRKLWWLDIVMMIPFMVPPYINSMGWMLFMQRNGILYRIFPVLRPLSTTFYSFFGMAWIMAMHTSPFLMTILKSAFLSFPKSLDDASDVYIKKQRKKFTKVYWPILLPNFSIGAFLVFVKALSEYGTPATFGSKINMKVFTTLITEKMQVAPIDFPMASSLASLLVTICMILWVIQMLIISKKTYALKDEGDSKYSKSVLKCVFSSLFLLIVFFLSAFIPLFTIIISSFKKVMYKNLSAEGNFTLENYSIAFSEDSGFSTGFKAIGNSFLIAFLSSLIILIIGLVIVIFSYKHKKTILGKNIEFLGTLPQMIPNIVTGIGMIMFFNTIYKAFPVYRTIFMLIIGYSVVFLPSMISYIKNSILQMPYSMIEAGEIYSRNSININLRIVLPQALKGAFYGFIMTLIISLRELVMAKLLQPPAFYTISLFIDNQFEQGNQQAAMAVAVVSVFITLALLIPLEYITMKKKRKDSL